MIDLYHCRDARSFRALWALEEMGLSYALHTLPFPPRSRQPDYLAINPLGTIPFLIDGPVRMSESAAVLQYVATRYGPTPLAVDPAEDEFGAWLDWIHFGEATLTVPQTLVLRYGQLEPEGRRSPQVVEDYRRWFLSRLRAVEACLAEREHLCAGRFTMADISVGYALLLAGAVNLRGDFTPAVQAYWERLRHRPAFLAARQKQR